MIVRELFGSYSQTQRTAKARRKGAKKDRGFAPLLRQQVKHLSPSSGRAIIRPRGRRCLRQKLSMRSRRVERREPRSLLARGERSDPLVRVFPVYMGRSTGHLIWLLNEATVLENTFAEGNGGREAE